MTVLADLRKGESAFCCVLASQGLGVETLLVYSFFRLCRYYVSVLLCKSKVFLSIVAEQDDNFSLDFQVRCLNVGFLYIIYHQSPTNTLLVFRDEVFCLRIMIFQKKF